MSSLWPPANFTEWPPTRIGALTINAILLLLVAIPSTRRLILVDSWKICCCCCHEVIKGAVLGFVIGMFLHFIPCLWWTCDWGEYDGEAVRGMIWFITGPIIGVWILWFECNRSKRERTATVTAEVETIEEERGEKSEEDV